MTRTYDRVEDVADRIVELYATTPGKYTKVEVCEILGNAPPQFAAARQHIRWCGTPNDFRECGQHVNYRFAQRKEFNEAKFEHENVYWMADITEEDKLKDYDASLVKNSLTRARSLESDLMKQATMFGRRIPFAIQTALFQATRLREDLERIDMQRVN